MKIMLTGFDLEGYITSYRDVTDEKIITTVGEETTTVPIEINNVSIFEINDIDFPDFSKNHIYYKVSRKKLKLDNEKKILVEEEKKRKSIITLKLELLNLKRQKMDFEVYDISTKEIDSEIEKIEKEINDLT